MIRAKHTAMIAAVALTLTACTDPQYLTEDRNRTQEGAVAGGIFGALLGASANDDNRLGGAIVGGAIGAAAGAAIGSHLDQQAEDLRRDLGDDRISIVNTGDELIVTMPQDILFATDSDTVRSDLNRDIRALAANLLRYPNTTVDVVGHTDNVGEASYNQSLSQRRAWSVATILLSEGVPETRLRAYGRGENDPVASNLTAEGRAQNRRVEIIIRPNS